MGSSVWEELLGKYSRCIRGAALVSINGEFLKSTLPKDDELALNERWLGWILTQIGSQIHQLDIKTDTGWILAARLNKKQILVVMIESKPYIRFKLDLIKLFVEDSTSDNASQLPDPANSPKPPKHDGAHAIPEKEG